MIYIGIDPGLFGGIAAVGPVPGQANVWDTPTLEVLRKSGSGTVRKPGKRTVYAVATMASLLRGATGGGPAVVLLESSSPHPGEGVVAAASIARGQALWEALAVALGLPLETTTPASWKRKMGLPTGADKDASRLLAMRLFPGLEAELRRKKDNGRAEALLLAEWGRRRNGGAG